MCIKIGVSALHLCQEDIQCLKKKNWQSAQDNSENRDSNTQHW